MKHAIPYKMEGKKGNGNEYKNDGKFETLFFFFICHSSCPSFFTKNWTSPVAFEQTTKGFQRNYVTNVSFLLMVCCDIAFDFFLVFFHISHWIKLHAKLSKFCGIIFVLTELQYVSCTLSFHLDINIVQMRCHSPAHMYSSHLFNWEFPSLRFGAEERGKKFAKCENSTKHMRWIKFN